MEYDVKFPDLSNYDISKPGDMALYHAHVDFMPFRSVIENTMLSVKASREYYMEHYKKASELEDFIHEDWAMTSASLYSARVVPLTYYSLVLVMVSLLEEAFNTLCRAYQLSEKYTLVQKDIEGQGLERAIKYLDKVAGVHGIKSDVNWEYVKTIRDARNMIVHNGGRVKGKTEVYEKFGFYIDETDHKLCFEYDDIVKMYDAIMDFIEHTFRIEPER